MDTKEQLRKSQIAFWINLILYAFAMIVLFQSVDKGVVWKVFAAAAGALGFLGLAILAFWQIKKLKESKNH